MRIIIKDALSGSGYCQFVDQMNFDAALKKDRQRIGQRYIEVFPSNESDRKKVMARSQVCLNDVDSKSVVIRMRGLPFSASQEDVKAFFEDIDVVSVHLTTTFHGRPLVRVMLF